MAKMKPENIELDNNEVGINEVKYKEEYCPVLWKKIHAFAIDYQGYGISFHTSDEHFLDTSKIKDVIKVNYIGEIGEPSFKIFPVYE